MQMSAQHRSIHLSFNHAPKCVLELINFYIESPRVWFQRMAVSRLERIYLVARIHYAGLRDRNLLQIN